jgi:precorrin-3B synthase
MQSGDGLLVRVKPSCGMVTLDQAEAIATRARDHGNGLIELTSRGNLQLRGVRAATLDALTSALDALGLLDTTPEAEAIRNIVSSPLAGIDETAFDTRPIVKALEQGLTGDCEIAGLSDKFGFLVDGGGVLRLDDIEADIRFVWTGDQFAIGLALESGCDWVGACSTEDVPGVAIALARSFLIHAGGARRVRLLSDAQRVQISKTAGVENRGQTHGSDPIRNVAVSNGSDTAIKSTFASLLPRTPSFGRVGTIEVGGGICATGIGLPYGGTTSCALLGLVALARNAGATELRLTPWRAILIPSAGEKSATSLLTQAATLGFITDPTDARRAIAACPGAPACASGTTPVRADADLFAKAAASLLGAGSSLHVSGCAKGCARRRAATLTVVADGGVYGLVVNGSASNEAYGCFTAPEIAEILARVPSAVTKAGDASHTSKGAAIEAALKEILAA